MTEKESYIIEEGFLGTKAIFTKQKRVERLFLNF